MKNDLTIEDYKNFIEILKDPPRWAETFLRNPVNPTEPLKLRIYQKEALSVTQNYNQMCYQFGRRCLSGDMPIQLSDGTFKQIKDINIRDVVVCRDKNSQIQHKSVINKYSNGIKEIYRIKLSDGRYIDCTKDHLLLAYVQKYPKRRVYEQKWLSLDTGLKKRSKIYVLRDYPVFGTIKNYSEAKLLGYLIDDGYLPELTSPQTPKFTSLRYEYILEVQSLIKELFGYDGTIKKRTESNAYDIHLTDGNHSTENKIKKYLHNIEIIGTKSKFRNVLTHILKYDRESLGFFLNRLWSGDGRVCNFEVQKNRISKTSECSLASCNYGFLNDIRLVLYKIGVRSKIREDNRKSPESGKLCHNWKLYFSDSISIENFLSFTGLIFGKEKQSAEALRICDTKKRKFFSKGSKFFYKSRIKSIEYIGGLETYDIEIEDHHNFMVNGIVTHNCGKTVLLSIDALWWTTAYPFIRMYENSQTKAIPFNVLFVAPMEVHIKLIFDTILQLINGSVLLENESFKIRRSDESEIIFNNGSKIKGMTIGISTSNKGTSIRGQGCDELFIDECDYIPKTILDESILPVTTSKLNVKLRISSTPSGKREYFWEKCFPVNTPISTPVGLKNIQDIKITDKVFTVDGKIDEVSNVFKHSHNGDFYKFKTKVSEFECTEDHPILATSRIELKPSYKSAKDIKKGHYVVHPIKNFPEVKLDFNVDIFKTSIEHQREMLYETYIESKLNKTEFERKFKTPRKVLQEFEYRIKMFGNVWMFDSRIRNSLNILGQTLNDINVGKFDLHKLCRLLGYYLSEGNIIKSKDYKSKSDRCFYKGISFSFNSNEFEYIKEVQQCILDLFPDTRIVLTNIKDSCTVVLCYNLKLAYLFKVLCDEYSHLKRIHPFFMSKRESVEILNTYVNGDGYCVNEKRLEKITSSQFSLTTTSKQLFDDLFNIAIKNKFSVSKYTFKKTNRKRVYSLYNLVVPFVFKDTYFLSRVKKVTISKRSEEVYNFETKETHQYIADNTLVHNCIKAKELGWWHKHVPAWHPDNPGFTTIEQAQKLGLPINQSSEFQFRNSMPYDAYMREYGAEFGDELQGVYKNSHIKRSLVKYISGIMEMDIEEFDPKFQQNPENLYILGVDWNSYTNGGQLVLVEFCRVPTFINNGEDKIPCHGKFRIFYRKGIRVEGATQRATRKEILRLVDKWKIDFIYVDYGHGDTNIEELTYYGKEHPHLQMDKKLRVVDSGSSIDHYDPLLKTMVSKRVKSMMVNLAVVNLEEDRILLPIEEDRKHCLVNQMRGYLIKSVTTRGDYTYEGDDHILDAYHLALYGFNREFSDLLISKHDTRIKYFGFNPHLEMENAPHRQESVKTFENLGSYPTQDPEKKTTKQIAGKPIFVSNVSFTRKSNMFGQRRRSF